MAKMPKREKSPKTEKISLDRGSEKAGRGRPGVRPEEIVGRAENFRRMFWSQCLHGSKKNRKWVRDQPYEWALALVKSATEEDALRALDSAPSYVQNEFRPLISLILDVLRESDFPKRQENQFDFLADSVAARGEVSPRRSRDICGEHRSIERAKSPYRILRKEFYIECSCGYKGPARDNACRKCGAEIPPSLGLGSGFGVG